MKHLVAVLAMFLLMGSQTLAQETVPEPEDLQDLPDFVMVNKPVVCGPIKQVLKRLKSLMRFPQLRGWNQNTKLVLDSG